MAAQIDLPSRLSVSSGKSNLQRPADEVGIDSKLNGLARLRGEKQLAAIFDRVGCAAFGCAAFPNLNIKRSFGGATIIAQFDFQRKGSTELKHPMETDPRLDRNRGARRGGNQQNQK